ncbi:hypothetical protein J6590_089266 [Homalodisca vitripennis]|nr:hypothetical protein J6590_089266 [Homalodisca vitripennis]
MKDYSLKTSNVTRGAPIQELYSGMPSEPTKRRRPTADDDAMLLLTRGISQNAGHNRSAFADQPPMNDQRLKVNCNRHVGNIREQEWAFFIIDFAGSSIKLRLRGKVYEINDLHPIRETLSFRFSITVDELCRYCYVIYLDKFIPFLSLLVWTRKC